MKLLRTPFVSALIGGLVVAALGAVALEAGWVEPKGSGEAVVKQATIARPALDQKNGDHGLTVNDIYKEAGPGVLFIRSDIVESAQSSPFDLPLPQGQRQQATGSGFVIDKDGYILTNAHVVENARRITVGFEDKQTAVAKLVGEDASSDVALLKVDTDKGRLHPLSLGNSSQVKVGDPVVAIGNPFGLDRTVTTGIASALQRRIQAPNGFSINNVIQTDASINPGNSGGPLIDAGGQVIGINSQIATAGGGGSVGVGFAVPIDTAKREIDQLKTKGKVLHAYLGITGISVDKTLTESLNLPSDKGVLVQDVTKDGPAEKAGLKGGNTPVTVNGVDMVLGGDVITKVDDAEVTSMRQLQDRVNAKKPGDQVKITYFRGKGEKTVTVKLAERPRNLEKSQPSLDNGPDQLPGPGQ